MSTALIATIPSPLRPQAIVDRYMSCQDSWISTTARPRRSGARRVSTIGGSRSAARAASPTPTMPVDVSTSTTSQRGKAKPRSSRLASQPRSGFA
jgi:hypothetical protein